MSSKNNIKITNKFKFARFCFFIILLIILLIFMFSFFIERTHNHNIDDAIQTVSDVASEQKKDVTIKLCAIGDIMCHNTQFQDAFNSSSNSYDFSYVFSEIAHHFKDNDLNIGNLETTFAGSARKYSGYPTFNTPEALATDLKELGINVLTTANNHCMDTGNSGLVNTLNVLDSVGIGHTGTYRTEEERNNLLIKDVNGIKIAFLSYTYGTNGIPVPSSKPFSVNLIDKEKIISDIKKAKDSNVDLICSSMHWGIEYQDSPNSEQKNLADFLFKNGVDIILGSHPHVLEKMEKVNVTTNDGENKDCFIIYSFGNFVSGQVKKNTKTSIILNLSITKKADDTISIDNISYIPIYCYTGNGSKRFKLIDIKQEIENYENGGSKYITSSTYKFFKDELDRVQKVLNWES